MTYPLTTPIPFAAGSSLCPPDYEPPCTCPPDGRIDPTCPVDGDREDVSAAGGAENASRPGSALTPVASPVVDGAR